MKKKTVLWLVIGLILAAAFISIILIKTGIQNQEDTANEFAENTVKEMQVSYPDYTEEGVANGHFTGGSDLRMVLLGFRDKLDRGDYGVEIALNKERDFALWQDGESGEIHAIMESADGLKYVIVTVGDAGIDRFPNLRQVHSFQIVSAGELNGFTENWTVYGSAASPQESGVNHDSEIIVKTGEVLIYHADHKGVRILLDGEDKELVESFFAAVSLVEDTAVQGSLHNVVKMEDCKYMFDWTGAGIKDVYDDGTVLLGFKLSQEDLELLEEMWRKYEIYSE